MKIFLTLIVFSLLFFTELSAFGQGGQFEYATIEVNDALDLKSKECYFITKDSKENLWVCTDLGVYKYDGYTTVHYTVNDGLLSNVVFEVYEDYKGRIWFLTKSTQLCYLENDEIKPFEFNKEIAAHCVYPTSDRKKLIVSRTNIYYSVDLCGYFTITPEGKIIENNNPVGRISLGVLEDSLITLGYKTTQRTREEILKDKVHFRGIYLNQGGGISSLSPDSIVRYKKFDINHLSIIKNKLRGIALLGGALYHFPSEQFLFQSASCFYPDPLHENAFWIGTKNGFFHATYQNSQFVITPNSRTLEGFFITSIYCDNSGNSWFSTLENGIYFLPQQRVKTLNTKNFLETSENITDFEFFQSQLYISTKAHLILPTVQMVYPSRYSLLHNYNDSLLFITNKQPNPLARKITPNNFKFLDFTRDILEHENEIYILSSLITKYAIQEEKTHTIYQSNLNKVKDNHFIKFAKKEKEIFLASTSAIFKLEKNNILQICDLQDKEITDLRFIPQLGMVISTKSHGLFTYRNNELKPFEIESKYAELQNISCLYYSPAIQTLFLGTYQGVIAYHIPSKRSVKLNQNHGFLDAKIELIKEHDEAIYIASFDKIFQIQRKDVNALISTGNQSYRVPASLTSILEDGAQASLPHEIKYSTDFITINFAIKDYTIWNNRTYQYRLNPSGQWNNLLSPQLIIPNPKASFQVQIRYQKSNDVWSEIVIDEFFRISPPFYKTFWFYALITLFLFVSIFYVLRRRLNRKIERLQTENNLLSYQQRLQNARIKPHFIFNILNSINSHILFNEMNEASNYLIKFSHLLRNLLEKTGTDTIKIENSLELIESYLELEQLRKDFGFHYTIDVDISLKTKFIPSMMIQPFVENAIIHGIKLEGDEISVSIFPYSDTCVRALVCNSGEISSKNQFKWEASTTTNAIGLCKDRIKNYRRLFNNPDLSVEIKAEKGYTIVELILPIIHSKENKSYRKDNQ